MHGRRHRPNLMWSGPPSVATCSGKHGIFADTMWFWNAAVKSFQEASVKLLSQKKLQETIGSLARDKRSGEICIPIPVCTDS